MDTNAEHKYLSNVTPYVLSILRFIPRLCRNVRHPYSTEEHELAWQNNTQVVRGELIMCVRLLLELLAS